MDYINIVKEFCAHHFCSERCLYWKTDNCVLFSKGFPSERIEECKILIGRTYEDIVPEEFERYADKFSK